MTTAAVGTSTRAGGMTKDEKFVIFASSLGTVFEWYDFYLYATLGAVFRRAVLSRPAMTPRRCCPPSRTYAAGFLVRPFGAFIFGRIGDLVGRKYTFLVTHRGDGRRDLPGRPAARRSRPSAGSPPILLVSLRLAPGPCARRRIWRCRDLRRRARAGRTSAATTTAWHPDHARRSASSWRSLVIGSAASYMDAKMFADGAGAFRSWISLVLLVVLGLDPAAAPNEFAGLREDEGRGQGLQGAADRKLPALSEQQIRAARAARRDGGPRRGVVHGPVLRAVLPDHHAQARLRARPTR